MKKNTVMAFSLFLTLAILLSGCTTGQETESAAKISTQLVKKGDLQIGVYADGRITVPVTQVNFAASGIIRSIFVEPGQSVLAGDLLAELDPSDSLEAIAAAETNLLKAQVAYEDAVRTRDYTLDTEKIKLQSLYAKYVSFFEEDDYEDLIQDAEEKVADLEAALALAEDTLAAWLAQKDESAESADAAESTEDSASTSTDDNDDFDSDISNAQKAVDEAKAELETAQVELQAALTSLSETFDRDDFAHAAAKEAYDLQRLKVDNLIASTMSLVNAELSLADAATRLSDARAVLDQTMLYAPVAGKVLEIAFEPGDDVLARTSTSSTGSAADFMTLYDPSLVQLVANVNEGDISSLEVGQDMRISVDALYLENQKGTVTEVSIMPKIDNTGIVTYAVTGVVEQPDERILDGMSVFVLFLKKEKTDVLLVPNKAVYMEDGKQHVQVQMADGTLEKRAVVLGLTNGSSSEVIEGLNAGENVVTGGVDR